MSEIKWTDEVQEKLVKILVEDWDASEHLAQEAVARFGRDNESVPLDSWPTLAELAEEIHETQSYWED